MKAVKVAALAVWSEFDNRGSHAVLWLQSEFVVVNAQLLKPSNNNDNYKTQFYNEAIQLRKNYKMNSIITYSVNKKITILASNSISHRFVK